MQINDLTQYAAARNLQIVETYQDHGVSGSRESRPALNRMMLDAKRRRFDLVLIWRFDRLGRSTSHLISLIEELQALQICIVSLREGFDLQTPSGRVMASIIAALASFERDLIRERVVAGIAAARRRGAKLGRPKTVPVEEVLELRNQGRTYREIMAILNISMGGVQAAVKSSADQSKTLHEKPSRS